ncbi:hypothetical protein MSG28_002588 [Choristoneura fumiferana]|uniref:Uncharacterized protein n=1 Tax=Choristoneura fumiferana TaxID=7141 RepID=A0ACC0JIG5_CHOFU|nr:hypothetical protein MSG28_002588 [Choristoneura fumiferana]
MACIEWAALGLVVRRCGANNQLGALESSRKTLQPFVLQPTPAPRALLGRRRRAWWCWRGCCRARRAWSGRAAGRAPGVGPADPRALLGAAAAALAAPAHHAYKYLAHALLLASARPLVLHDAETLAAWPEEGGSEEEPAARPPPAARAAAPPLAPDRTAAHDATHTQVSSSILIPLRIKLRSP